MFSRGHYTLQFPSVISALYQRYISVISLTFFPKYATASQMTVGPLNFQNYEVMHKFNYKVPLF